MRTTAFLLAASTTSVLCAIPAAAAPAAPDAAVGVTASVVDDSAVITIADGAIVLRDGVLTLEGPGHSALEMAEMSFRIDDFTFPIDAAVADRTVTLTPRLDREHAVYTPVALPYEDSANFTSPYQREVAAWNRLTSTVGLGVSLGTLVGGIGGAAVGCVLGAVAGATVAAATIVGLFGSFLPAGAIGCLGGVLAIGALGTVAGQLLVSAPVAVLAAVQYVTTVTA
ncbi:hypothetical protein [Nocardia concava]|uniref:hypothetical protein n=1 Tax=Nocardia concava TaxID=257281 RepID=UPI0002D5623A|nr:hypothetical protein [Nocardia concava]